MKRTAAFVVAAVVLLLAVLAFAPHAAGDAPVTPTTIPASAFVPLSVVLPSVAPRSAGPGDPGVNPALQTPAPATGNSPRPTPRTRPAARVIPAARSGTRVAGIASTYGPGFDGYLALPAGPGIRVRICGAGGCVVAVSNDAGPVPSLHRVADLDVATFERVCGLSWTAGLCRVTVTPWP